MCGISGIAYHSGQSSSDITALIKASQSLKHRGPDDEGFFLAHPQKFTTAFGKDTSQASIGSGLNYSPKISLNDNLEPYHVALIHRRLSIIDLSVVGHQPMCDEHGTNWITYNGEIYNYKELKLELTSKGFHFKSETDTEVILNAYKCWGNDCVNHFNGMWSFVIFNSTKNILFGSRDRVGVKPFYYTIHKNYFAFASEQKALLKTGWVKFELNKKAAFDFLFYDLLEHEAESLFKNILELKPSCSFEFDLHNGEFKSWQYYELKFNESVQKYNEQQAAQWIETIHHLVTDSIRARLQSDAKVGSCLSGGIDSSVIVCTLNNLMKENSFRQIGTTQEVFHSTFDIKKYDESNYAMDVAAQTKVNIHIVKPTAAEFLKDIEKLTLLQDLPIRSISSYSQYRVMQLAKEHGIKVILDGQGGDELFGGYYRYITSWLHDVKLADGYAAFKNEKSKYFPDVSMRNEFLKYSIKEKIKQSFLKSTIEKNSSAHKFIHKDLANQFINSKQQSENSKTLNQSLNHDFSNGYLKELLYREDRNGMAHSIEARVPFADDHLLSEFVFSIPGNYKIRNGYSKYLLREAFKTTLPNSIYQRKDKMGFSTPNNEWLSELKNEFKKYITPDLEGIYNLSAFKNNYDSFFNVASKQENYKTLKWIMFPVWLKVFKDLC